ncbi:MAG: transcription elongation factor Spt5 [Desulfurococcales archaeon]|nr:transcription elongation factor Spt5 [Desulfurococcales archaeon]
MNSETTPVRRQFYGISVTAGREIAVALIIKERVTTMNLPVYSIIVPDRIRGMIILEVEGLHALYQATLGVKHIKRRRPVLVKDDEIEQLVVVRPVAVQLKPGDIVTIIRGPLRGVKGRVISVNEKKEEVELSILETDFRMTTTVPLDDVRPIEGYMEGE